MEKKPLKRHIKEFMLISMGKAGTNIRFSKFGTMIFAIFITVILTIGVNLVINEISQRNKEIERHRKNSEELQKKVNEKDAELEELKEFKKLLDAIKKLSKNTLKKKQQTELAKVIYIESKKYKYNWRMITSVIMTESSFRSNLSSSDPSYGLMQIKIGTAQETGKKMGLEVGEKEELFNISKNVSIGGYYLFEQILRFDDVKKGIVAYNLGPGRTAEIDKKKGGADIETKYLKKVLKHYNYLKKNF